MERALIGGNGSFMTTGGKQSFTVEDDADPSGHAQLVYDEDRIIHYGAWRKVPRAAGSVCSLCAER